MPTTMRRRTTRTTRINAPGDRIMARKCLPGGRARMPAAYQCLIAARGIFARVLPLDEYLTMDWIGLSSLGELWAVKLT